MKRWTETVTHREGEWLGDIDTYDWKQHGLYPNDPEYVDKLIAQFMDIQRLFHEGHKIKIWFDPMIAGDLLEIGFYDGWPYWKPTPAILLSHWSGAEVHFWSDIHSYKITEEAQNG